MRGLLVDFGGVLTTSVLDSFAGFARDEGIDPETLAKVMRDIAREPAGLFRRVEIGEIDTDEFEIAFAAEVEARCSVRLTPSGLKSRMFAGASLDERMLGALAAARRNGVRTALVSNSWGVTNGGYPVERFGDLFDSIVISGEVGLRKPDREIYLMASERVGIAPAACVFVDDFAINVEGAEATGMTGLLHRSADETLARLEGLLGVPLA